MPESPDSDFDGITEKAKKIAREFGAKGEMSSKLEPMAFGLKKIVLMAVYEVKEEMSYDDIADKMAEIEGVQNAEMAQMDLPLG